MVGQDLAVAGDEGPGAAAVEPDRAFAHAFEPGAVERDLATRRDRLTAEIDRAEKRIGEINETFCDPTYFERTPRDKVAKLEGEQKKLGAKVDELMAEWETVEREIGALEASLGEVRAVG
jgi:transposase